jgi:conflict system pore-forming effector with SLATT domain
MARRLRSPPSVFALNVIEHLRLNFGLVVQNHTAHARAAERMSALAFRIKIGQLLLVALAGAAVAVGLFRPERAYQIAGAVLLGLALAAQIAAIAYGVEARVHSHRQIAHRLWLMCERYRALLTEIQDGGLDHAAILARRDLLSAEMHAIYGQAFPVDHPALETARQLPLDPGGPPVSDAQLDPVIPVARKAS